MSRITRDCWEFVNLAKGRHTRKRLNRRLNNSGPTRTRSREKTRDKAKVHTTRPAHRTAASPNAFPIAYPPLPPLPSTYHQPPKSRLTRPTRAPQQPALRENRYCYHTPPPSTQKTKQDRPLLLAPQRGRREARKVDTSHRSVLALTLSFPHPRPSPQGSTDDQLQFNLSTPAVARVKPAKRIASSLHQRNTRQGLRPDAAPAPLGGPAA